MTAFLALKERRKPCTLCQRFQREKDLLWGSTGLVCRNHDRCLERQGKSEPTETLAVKSDSLHCSTRYEARLTQRQIRELENRWPNYTLIEVYTTAYTPGFANPLRGSGGWTRVTLIDEITRDKVQLYWDDCWKKR